jgi:hypothetical protein
MPQRFDAEQFREMVYAHPGSEYVRWWRAIMDPSWSPKAGVPGSGREKWLREEQTGVSDYRAVVQGVQVLRRFYPQGTWEVGDILLTTMPDELPFGANDWICPMGRSGSGSDTTMDARVLPFKEAVVRGGDEMAMAGTVSSSGTAITGSGTAFSTALRIGDVLKAAGQSRRVVSITDPTHLAVDTAPSPVWSSVGYVRGREALGRSPAWALELVRDASTTYVVSGDVDLSTDGTELQWASAGASPAAGATVSLAYRHFARYVVLPDYEMTRVRVGGVALPQRVTARLVWGTRGES